MNKLQKLYDRMQNSKGIPAVENTVNELLTALGNGKTNTKRLVELITSDVALTQKVLRLVNSSMYSSFSKDISTVSDAIRILGHKAIIHIVLGAILITNTELEEDEELAKITLASEFAKCATESSKYENASIAALLYNIGKLLVSKYLKDEMDEIDALVMQGINAEEAEQQVLNMTLQTVGVGVAKIWKFPDSITSIIDDSGDPALINLARFSNVAASLIHEGRASEVTDLITKLSFSDELKGRLSALVVTKSQTVTIKLKPEMLRSKAFEHIREPQITLIEPIVVSNTYKYALDKILQELKDQKFAKLFDIVSFTFKRIMTALSTSRCLYIKPSTAYGYSVAYGLGDNVPNIINCFILNKRSDPNVMLLAIENNADISITDVNKISERSLPGFYKALLPKAKRFMLLPVSFRGSIRGLIYLEWEDNDSDQIEELLFMKKIRDLIVPFSRTQ